MLKYRVLATDYDGTIAHQGVVDEPTVTALQRAKAGGIQLMLVTGRRLQDFPAVFPEWTLFDRVVAENGAELFNPSSGESKMLAPPPPAGFLDRLREQDVPLWIGKSVVATIKPHDRAVTEAIASLGMEWHLIYNKDDVMVLPAGVSKSSGLLAGLGDLQIPVEQSVAVGDAENDLEMFAACGFAVAVANALDSVKAAAKWVTPGERGAGVAQLIDRLLRL